MKVLLVWELGAQLGHIGTLLPIADALAAQGHEVVFALKDLSHAHTLIGTRYPFLQSPRRVDKIQPGRRFESFADILLHAGFHNVDILKDLVTAWQALYAQLRPDWVIYNHAPVALFSARGLHFKKTCVGSGFEIPPGDIVFPRFRHWEPDTASSSTHRKHSLSARV
jgi:UDP:flavonoid glycosyltransferase YjiC (YdhE family)